MYKLNYKINHLAEPWRAVQTYFSPFPALTKVRLVHERDEITVAICPATGHKERGYWSGNRVVRGIYGCARDQLRENGVLEVKTLSEMLYVYFFLS